MAWKNFLVLLAVLTLVVHVLSTLSCVGVGDDDDGAASDRSDNDADDDDEATHEDDDTASSDDDADVHPNYTQDVAPIVMANCVSCHQANQIGDFSLTTYQDALDHLEEIKKKTERREMPPYNWDNSGECQTYQDARWLEDDEISLIGEWVDSGAPQGPPDDMPPVPDPPSGLEQVDAVIEMGSSYTPDSSRTDEYRCFVLDPCVDTDRFITQYEVVPGETREVHHLSLWSLNTPQAEAEVEALDAADSGEGYECGMSAEAEDSDYMLGWAPGTGVVTFPQGTGRRILGGRKVVMQVHYNMIDGDSWPDRSRIKLTLVDHVDKEAIIYRWFGLASLDLPPGQELVTQTKTFEVPPEYDTIWVYGSAPHMHYLGKTLLVEYLRDGQWNCLTRVNDWDFHWQGLAFYTQPIALHAGESLRITCGYDTRGQDETVHWGYGTDDEMCSNFLYVTL